MIRGRNFSLCGLQVSEMLLYCLHGAAKSDSIRACRLHRLHHHRKPQFPARISHLFPCTATNFTNGTATSSFDHTALQMFVSAVTCGKRSVPRAIRKKAKPNGNEIRQVDTWFTARNASYNCRAWTESTFDCLHSFRNGDLLFDCLVDSFVADRQWLFAFFTPQDEDPRSRETTRCPPEALQWK